MTVYAVGDIHGQLEMLHEALARIEADGGCDAEVVFLGDLVDRGPGSCGVIQTLMDGIDAGRRWTVLRGNHDQYFIDFLTRGRVNLPHLPPELHWLSPRLGGAETLASYGVAVTGDDADPDAVRRAVPEAHLAFLRGLPYWHERGELLFVHAGIEPGKPLGQHAPETFMFMREPFVSWTGAHPWLVVHGHTPLEHPTHFGNRVDLDGGAGYGRPLVPVVFEGREAWLLTEAGRVPLRP